MNNWTNCKIGDFLTFHYGKSLSAEKRVEGNIPVYSSAGLTGWHNEALVESEGLIIGRKGTIGKVYKSKQPFFVIDTAYYIKPDQEKYDLDYVYYLLSSIGLDELNEDSAVPGLNRNTAYAQEISLPPLPEQKAIAEVLSSLDDKIDLLHRQNQTLEKLAESHFRHLFIDNAKDDWEEGKLGDLTLIGSGKGLSRDNFLENGLYPVLGANGVIGRTNKFLIDERLIYTGRVGTLGNIFISNGKVWLSDNTLILRPKNHQYFFFVYFFMKNQNFLSQNVGSTQPLIRQSDVKNLDLAIPPDSEIIECNEIFESSFAKIEANIEQIKNLEKTRDQLLPKLMSGEIKIEL